MERLVKHHLNRELKLDITSDKTIDSLLILCAKRYTIPIMKNSFWNV